MDIFLNILIGITEQGLIYAILALGVYMSYKILNFPDLSVDGTFAFGGAVAAAFISRGANPWLTLLLAFLCGSLCGIIVGIMHVKFKITDLLCGIIMMTGLYSINLRIAGSSLLSIGNKTLIFNGNFAGIIDKYTKLPVLIIVLILVIIVKIALDLYMKTKSGMLLKAVGDNKKLIEGLGENPDLYKIIGLALGNGLAALAGSILCQQQKCFEINMGVGMMVMAIASLIIGVSIFKRVKIMADTTKVIIGSIIYKACVSAALNFGLKPDDLKLVMALLFFVILVANNFGREKDAELN